MDAITTTPEAAESTLTRTPRGDAVVIADAGHDAWIVGVAERVGGPAHVLLERAIHPATRFGVEADTGHEEKGSGGRRVRSQPLADAQTDFRRLSFRRDTTGRLHVVGPAPDHHA